MTDTDLYQTLGRMEGNIDRILDTQTEIRKALARQEDRLAIVEGWRWKTIGGAGVASGVIAWLMKL